MNVNKMHMEKTVNERIRCLIDHLGISDKKFAEMIGVPQTTISNLFNRQTEPGYKILNAIMNHIEYISSDWLLTGKGDMITQNVNQTNEHGDNINTASGNISVNKTNDENIKALMNRIEELMKERDEYKDKVIELQQTIIEMIQVKK